MISIPVWNVCVWRRVIVIADTIHTTCSSTEDTAKNIVFLVVIFWTNLEGATIDGNGAIAIERIVHFVFIFLSTTCTSSI